jgi:hypothetical protein
MTSEPIGTRHAGVPHPALSLALNFVREHTPESCTRLCALSCCLTGCCSALATVAFAFRNPEQAATVASLVGVTSALIAAGCVALLTRTRKTALDTHQEEVAQ